MKKRITLILPLGLLLICGCTGRRADNMEPVGETIEVVIPDGDVPLDSAVAAGEIPAGDSVREAVVM